MNLTEEQIERYARQLILPEVGSTGQEKLLAGRVLLVGTGGLGSPAGFYLAAAGVGTIGVIDADEVDLTNLQRQVIHFTTDLGSPKVDSAAAKMRAINPGVQVQTYQKRLTADNALEILGGYDFVIDATDNLPSKFLIADACHFTGKPYSHAGVAQFKGQTMTVKPGRTTCYRCVFNAPPPVDARQPCAPAGVIGVLPGVVGTLQATEAIKFLLNQGELLTDCLLVYNALQATFRKVALKRSPTCPLCGEDPSITELTSDPGSFCP